MVVRGTWIGTLASEDKRCVQKDKARKRVFCVFFHFLLRGGKGEWFPFGGVVCGFGDGAFRSQPYSHIWMRLI